MYFGVFDARDSTLVPLQLILLILASVETIEGLMNIISPGDSLHPHVYAHLGSYTLAYTSALFVIACRPARARGMLILVTVAAIGFFSRQFWTLLVVVQNWQVRFNTSRSSLRPLSFGLLPRGL